MQIITKSLGYDVAPIRDIGGIAARPLATSGGEHTFADIGLYFGMWLVFLKLQIEHVKMQRLLATHKNTTRTTNKTKRHWQHIVTRCRAMPLMPLYKYIAGSRSQKQELSRKQYYKQIK